MTETHWTKTILPRRGLLDIPWRELWQYRDLVWLMAKRNLTAQYKQTVLGPSWFIIQPLLTTAVFSFLFGRIAGMGTDNIPHFLFYMSGLVMFGFFSAGVTKPRSPSRATPIFLEKSIFHASSHHSRKCSPILPASVCSSPSSSSASRFTGQR